MCDRQYLYCVIEGDELPSGVPSGLEGAALQTLACDGIAGVVSSIARSQVLVDLNDVIRHEMIVEKLMCARTLLPVRFGTVFKDRQDVLQVLSQRRSTFLNGLDLVRGKVELGVRVMAPNVPPVTDTPTDGDPPHLGPGRRFMADRMRLHARSHALGRQFEALGSAINDRLMSYAQEHRLWRPASEKTAMNAAYLVRLEQLLAFRCEVERLRLARSDLQFLLTGPWPPYSFVTPDVLESGISISTD